MGRYIVSFHIYGLRYILNGLAASYVHSSPHHHMFYRLYLTFMNTLSQRKKKTLSSFLCYIHTIMPLYSHPYPPCSLDRTTFGRDIYVYSILCLRILGHIFRSKPEPSTVSPIQNPRSGNARQWVRRHRRWCIQQPARGSQPFVRVTLCCQRSAAAPGAGCDQRPLDRELWRY